MLMKTFTSKIALNVTEQNVAEILYVREIQLFWSKIFDLDFLKNVHVYKKTKNNFFGGSILGGNHQKCQKLSLLSR